MLKGLLRSVKMSPTTWICFVAVLWTPTLILGAKVYKFVGYDGTELNTRFVLAKRNSIRSDDMVKYLQPRLQTSQTNANSRGSAASQPGGLYGSAPNGNNLNHGYPRADNTRYVQPAAPPSLPDNDQFTQNVDAGDRKPAESRENEETRAYGNIRDSNRDRSRVRGIPNTNLYRNRGRFGFQRRDEQRPVSNYRQTWPTYGNTDQIGFPKVRRQRFSTAHGYEDGGSSSAQNSYGNFGRFDDNDVRYYGGYIFPPPGPSDQGQGHGYGAGSHLAGPNSNAELPGSDGEFNGEAQARYSNERQSKPTCNYTGEMMCVPNNKCSFYVCEPGRTHPTRQPCPLGTSVGNFCSLSPYIRNHLRNPCISDHGFDCIDRRGNPRTRNPTPSNNHDAQSPRKDYESKDPSPKHPTKGNHYRPHGADPQSAHHHRVPSLTTRDPETRAPPTVNPVTDGPRKPYNVHHHVHYGLTTANPNTFKPPTVNPKTDGPPKAHGHRTNDKNRGHHFYFNPSETTKNPQTQAPTAGDVKTEAPPMPYYHPHYHNPQHYHGYAVQPTYNPETPEPSKGEPSTQPPNAHHGQHYHKDIVHPYPEPAQTTKNPQTGKPTVQDPITIKRPGHGYPYYNHPYPEPHDQDSGTHTQGPTAGHQQPKKPSKPYGGHPHDQTQPGKPLGPTLPAGHQQRYAHHYYDTTPKPFVTTRKVMMTTTVKPTYGHKPHYPPVDHTHDPDDSYIRVSFN